MDVIVKVRNPGRKPGREDKGVQSKKENKDGGNDFGVCVCTDQQLSACEIADIY